MNKCDLALTNILTTGLTAYLEYATAPTEEEGIKKIGKRIKKNKTIESIIECVLQDDSSCKCQQDSYTQKYL
ncbi:MAG: hypothetical protein IIC67_06035 [Thaumarchaeota archaeon]|nr:hypothetical protein [Nitrososphaerota archaeon]